jgi:hypothetical protein
MKNTLLIIIMSLIIGALIGFYTEKTVASDIQNECDSIRSESFVKDLTIMRYEYMIDVASEDTACKKLLDSILNNTE